MRILKFVFFISYDFILIHFDAKIELQNFDDGIFAKKILKLHRTLRKLETNKYLEPHMSYAFEELNDILIHNFKDNSSVNGSSVLGGGSAISGVSGHQAFSNNLRDKVINHPGFN